MKRNILLAVACLALLVTGAGLIGCAEDYIPPNGQNGSNDVVHTPPDNPNSNTGIDEQEEMLIRLAPIHYVQVIFAESFPVQVFVNIKGGLTDGCTTFHGTTTERSGNTINITVTTQRPKDAICTQIYGYFEENVPLGSDFTSGETYTINVNDYTAIFKMP